MTELLAPAGNMEALKAAIANGCDAIYLGLQKFGARAYSDNFSADTLKEAVDYAHLRDVKIYVTMNTIVFEDEISDMQEQLRQLNEICVDGIIVQDLAVFDYVEKHFADMEVHCSTQMGIDDLEGTLLFKELGADRVVLAREVDIDKAKAIRKAAKIPLEIFVHGALCVSYLRKLPHVRADRIPQRQPRKMRGLVPQAVRDHRHDDGSVSRQELHLIDERPEYHRLYG